MNVLIDTLYCCSIDCTKSEEWVDYGRGIFVGLVSYHTYMYKTTIIKAMIHLLTIYSHSTTIAYGAGSKINKLCIPETWLSIKDRAGSKRDKDLLISLLDKLVA